MNSTAVKAVNNIAQSAYSANILSSLQKDLKTQIQEFTRNHESNKELKYELNELFSQQDF